MLFHSVCGSPQTKRNPHFKEGIFLSGGVSCNLELFHDVTSGSLFSDIPDIANYSDVTADEVKVDIDELISSRRNQL